MKIGNVSKQIERLPGVPLHDHARSWLNAVTGLVAGADAAERRGIETFLDAMHEEWDRRRAAPRAGDLATRWPANVDTRWYDRDEPAANSPLGVHGYHVGRVHGQPPALRREILTRCYLQPLMPAFPAATLAAWSAPATPRRLAQIKSFLAYLLRRHEGELKMKDSVRDWGHDLDFLEQAFDARPDHQMR